MSLKSALDNCDKISEEFARRKREGLPPPTLDEIDILVGRKKDKTL